MAVSKHVPCLEVPLYMSEICFVELHICELIDVEAEKLTLGVDPGAQEVESEAYYRCRKCR